jgi:hypothetical protein
MIKITALKVTTKVTNVTLEDKIIKLLLINPDITQNEIAEHGNCNSLLDK